jgi:uncharacterized flavoprotein (TIGR03862 family)
MAAEVLSQQGVHVEVYDAMPSVGRKFLMAGKGGMNITHSEPLPAFLERYGARREQIKLLLENFSPDALREWIQGLGIATFVGSSGRVFPTDMKAAPLLRAWLHRLRGNGVVFHMRHRWTGWDDAGGLCFDTPEGVRMVRVGSKFPLTQRDPLPIPLPQAGEGVNVKTSSVDAVVLALGGGSWPQLGSNAAWVSLLQQRNIEVAALQPSNCGFEVVWSGHFKNKFSGQPLKSVVAGFTDAEGVVHRRQGDCVVTDYGIEGGLIYALSAPLRDTIAVQGYVDLSVDLTPGRDLARVSAEMAYPRGSRSLSSHLQSRVGLNALQTGLLRECVSAADFSDPAILARAIKALPVRLIAPRPMAGAISTAGGVKLEMLDQNLMLKNLPGIFCAGEMLDWEAPTGGYLLTACFASGKSVGDGVLRYLKY